MDNKRENMLITVAVVFGGRSVEHEVSVISGLQTIQNIDENKYNIVPIYISKNGKWYTGEKLLHVGNYKSLKSLISNVSEVYMTPDYKDNYIYFRNRSESISVDVVFPVLHGGTGEDGSIQGFLNLKGVPFVGSSVLSSSVGMDKVCMKQLLETQDLPVVNYVYFYDFEWYKKELEILKEINSKLSYPLIVKPANLGSSIGISKVENENSLIDAIKISLQFTNKILIENAIAPLKEINSSVIGDLEDQNCSVLEEPLTSGELLSYEDKYTSNNNDTESIDSSGMSSLKRKIPAEISKDLETKIKDTSIKTFKSLNCNGVVRIDYLIDTKNDRFYINEINSIPGSLSFYLWEPIGITFKAMLDKLILLSIKRWREASRFKSNFEDVNLFNLEEFSGKK